MYGCFPIYRPLSECHVAMFAYRRVNTVLFDYSDTKKVAIYHTILNDICMCIYIYGIQQIPTLTFDIDFQIWPQV